MLRRSPPDAIYDAIIGNILGARAADDPNLLWSEVSTASTHAQAKKGDKPWQLRVLVIQLWKQVDRDQIVKLQLEDCSVQKYKERDSPVIMGDQTVAFEERDGILYRIYQHPKVNNGQPVRQVIVPEPLCRQVMQLAHDSFIEGGYLGAKKMMHWILNDFYWMGIKSDVSHFYHSCEVCHQMVSKGSVGKVPLGRMTLKRCHLNELLLISLVQYTC